MSKQENVVYDNQREGRTEQHNRHNWQSATGEHNNWKTTSLQRSPTDVSRHRKWPLNLKMGQKETEWNENEQDQPQHNPKETTNREHEVPEETMAEDPQIHWTLSSMAK